MKRFTHHLWIKFFDFCQMEITRGHLFAFKGKLQSKNQAKIVQCAIP
ncbi:hypothetical protein Arad_12029 (plasmid) [Rhizobium rhizogenes K84]|uniref:Uncharacterized protein n=1 Tax=Rhizobium rhizogenes (strain K84 / ATCC BAA-868) TaxID=311403 RepID=B9JPP3_RHIR8|nr:hypothetical protein Arad_12029 [Rhizobium rhizogenes K84]